MRFITISILFFFVLPVFAQKTDTIVHVNGNVLTGEIKKLDFGIVSFKMDGMGTINYETDKIQTIKSRKYFEIKLSNGLYYFGTFDTSYFKRKVKINLGEKVELVDLSEIIEVYPIKKNFWLRMSGQFDLGFDFSKGSGIGKLNFNGNLNYRKRKSYFEFAWSNNTTSQSDTISSAKSDISLNFQRYLKNRWSLSLQTGVNQNTELGLDLRAFISVLGIWDIIHNNKNRFFVGSGLSGNREWTKGDTTGINNIELSITTSYKLFKYISPKVDVATDFTVFPNLTTSGRVRVEYNLTSKYEIFNDFYVGLNLYYSYDNKPTSLTASDSDYGISSTVGYSFH